MMQKTRPELQKSFTPVMAVRNGSLDKCKAGNYIDKVLSFLSQNVKADIEVSANTKLCNIVVHVLCCY